MGKMIKGYKGFNNDLTCNGFKYELGKSYKTEDIAICSKGFHFCKNPLDVFSYYDPTKKFAEVTGEGKIETHNEDSKVCCSEIHIGAEVNLNTMIKAGIDIIFSKVKKTKSKKAHNTGDYSAASVNGKQSFACGLGIENKVKGALTCWLILTEWHQVNCEWAIKDCQTVLVDGRKIKADTWYMLKDKKIVECT